MSSLKEVACVRADIPQPRSFWQGLHVHTFDGFYNLTFTVIQRYMNVALKRTK